jgi:hypothetical protein
MPAELPISCDLRRFVQPENGRYHCAFGVRKPIIESGTTSLNPRGLKPPPRPRCTKPFIRPRCQCGDQCRIGTEEKIAGCQPPPVSDPALRQMVRPIVQHVAALTERAQILHPIVGRVAIQVRRCEHDARLPKPSRLDKIGPSGRVPSAVSPRSGFFVEPMQGIERPQLKPD